MIQVQQTRKCSACDAIPVTQSKVGAEGNCWSAAVASILEIGLWEVPEFSTDDKVWLKQAQEWLASRGLYYVQIAPDEPTVQAAFRSGRVLHLIEGQSFRGGQHAIVGVNGQPWWDPHPTELDGTRPGLKTITCYGLLCKRF